MVLKKLPRNAAMDGVDLYRRLDDPGDGSALGDPARIEAFVDELRSNLTDNLKTPSTVAGWRAQALFASLVAALDECDLLTMVDTGEIYYADASVKAPDYFLHLRSGKRMLVDVKNVALRNEDSLDMPVKFTQSEVARMREFGDRFGAEVFLALYVPRMATWLLVDIDDLTDGPGGGKRITIQNAILRNQLYLLGDKYVGTAYPLEFVMRHDPRVSSTPGPKDEDGRRNFQFKVGSVELLAGGVTITDPQERRILHFFMLYGSWNEEEIPLIVDGELVEIRYKFTPDEIHQGGKELLGTLASMYSRMFEYNTSDASGPLALDVDVEPGTLVTLIPHDFDFANATLPLWLLTVHPADKEPEEVATNDRSGEHSDSEPERNE
ncbi:hypothetical protein [Microbacterium sp. W4I20]|uniref:hypothetical protein n=1 Tax=Microbacterium sp. W4I20 TaxID=3042262 RepID=UPI0027855099|nr:hypothetical protein [Microbacterium sp. W4I20]MDQ0727471.1 Holliday junction resolvase [Microbacterium sp. W4I20]